ncbi:SemiSWEET family sugar transporter [Candidatus Margulisiibacteriota bacterium]
MDHINILGMAAGVLTTTSFVPQVVKTWKTKSAGDISMVMLASLSAGIFLWMIYGIFMGALPIIIANSVTLVLAVSVLIMKVIYK